MTASSQAPTHDDLVRARDVFAANETRDLFYRVATELVALALKGRTSVTPAEALAVLLQTWNRSYYQYRRFDQAHLSELEALLADTRPLVENQFRLRPLESMTENDAQAGEFLFGCFEDVLGPVGAAKCLHLLAPRFFPLWDRKIARCYGVALRSGGSNAKRYQRFMELTRELCKDLGGEAACGTRLLKALDEYNYSRFTKRWM